MVGKELVQGFCSFLVAGRTGMTESELVELLAPGDPPAGIPHDHLGNVAALQRLLRPYLMHRGEVIDFYHGQLKEAVEEEYMSEEGDRLAAHRELASFFEAKADPGGNSTWSGSDPRAFAELPHQLFRSDDFAGLRRLVQEGFFERKTVVIGEMEALNDLRQIAEAFQAAGDDFWEDLVRTAYTYCALLERLRRNPQAMMLLVEQDEVDRVLDWIDSETDDTRKSLLAAAASALLAARGHRGIAEQLRERAAEMVPTQAHNYSFPQACLAEAVVELEL
jgi:hypothetical protein